MALALERMIAPVTGAPARPFDRRSRLQTQCFGGLYLGGRHAGGFEKSSAAYWARRLLAWAAISR
jgi:hypothetical protein